MRAAVVAALVLVGGSSLALAAQRPRARGPAGRLAQLADDQLEMLIGQSAQQPYLERLATVSRLFLGTPYLLDPLGEGEQGTVDKDPLVDLGRVDCQTFVEQVMALAGAKNLASASERLRLIRYKNGSIEYRMRHHLMALGWIPGNARAGYLKDITREVGGLATRVVEKTVDATQWRGKFAAMYKRLGDVAPSGQVRLDYIPLDAIAGVTTRLPRTSIAYVVAEPQEGVPYVVTHMGLVIRPEQGPVIFRHASAHPVNRSVVDVPLLDYVAQLQRGTSGAPATADRQRPGQAVAKRRPGRRRLIGLAFSEPLLGPRT
jgi:hypothetical protein